MSFHPVHATSFVVAGLVFVLFLAGVACSQAPPAEARADAGAAASRGQALVDDRGCASCHQSPDPGSGTLSGRTTAIVPGGVYPKNLTPDLETGIGRWSTTELVRAIREGIGDDGAALCDAMPRFADLSEDDAAAIAAYLRSLPAVHRTIPENACDDGSLDRDAGLESDSRRSDGRRDTGGPDELADATTDAAPAPPVGGPPWPAAGELEISEIMFDPSGNQPDAEWFEVHSTVDAERALSGLTIVSSNARTHLVLGAPVLVLPPRAYMVFVRSRAAAVAAKVLIESAAIDAYEYGGSASSLSGVLLANGATGTLAIHAGVHEVAAADYGGWNVDHRGASIQRSSAADGGAERDRWCVSRTAWTAGSDLGTPGAKTSCAAPPDASL